MGHSLPVVEAERQRQAMVAPPIMWTTGFSQQRKEGETGMAWCRWSTDSYNCDLYVYEKSEGHALHVARSRLIWDEPFPKPSLLELSDVDRDGRAGWAEKHRQWTAAYSKAAEEAQSNRSGTNGDRRPCWLDHGAVPGRLEHAGRSYMFATAEELVGFARRLEYLGFNGPSCGWEGYV